MMLRGKDESLMCLISKNCCAWMLFKCIMPCHGSAATCAADVRFIVRDYYETAKLPAMNMEILNLVIEFDSCRKE